MKKLLRILVLTAYSTVVLCMIGCGENEKDAAFVSANPSNNSTIDSDEVITVIFDNTPVTVDVEIQGHSESSFLWELDGRTLTVRGNSKFRTGRNYVIIITWATGRKILNYMVRAPQPPPDEEGIIINYREGEKTLHADVDGFLLKVEGVEIYRQFQGTQTGGITLAENDEIEVQVIFLNSHEEELHLDEIDEAAFDLGITGYDSSIIEVHLLEEDKKHGEEDSHLRFEVIGLKAGKTTIKLQLIHGDHPDFTAALLISITVQ